VSYVAGDAATLILDIADGTVRLVDFAPHPGWITVRVTQTSPTHLEARLESISGQVRFAATLVNGAVVTELDAPSVPGVIAPDNSTPGTGPDNSTPGTGPDNSTPGTGPDNSTPGTGPDNSTPGTGPDDSGPTTSNTVGDDHGGSGGGSDDNGGSGGGSDDDNSGSGSGSND
jgi:hypothetical protein